MYQRLTIISILEVMIARDSMFKVFSLVCVLFVLLCSCNKENVPTQTVQKLSNFGSEIFVSEGAWGIADGLEVIDIDHVNRFVFDIESPPSAIRKSATIRFREWIVLADTSIIAGDKEVTVKDGYPFYWMNTLESFSYKTGNGIYFYCSTQRYPYGSDPCDLTMWVFFDDEVYSIQGTIPTFSDWNWDEVYTYDGAAFKETDSILYQQIKGIWDDDMERFRTKVVRHVSE